MHSQHPVRTLAALAATIAACTTSRPPASAQLPRSGLRAELLGCYALYKPDGKRLDSSFYNSSPLVRLDSIAARMTSETSPAAFRSLVRLDSVGNPVDQLDPTSFLGRMWWADSLTDSVRLSFSDGFSGALAILAAPHGRADTLSGRIEEDWDMGPSVNQRGAVRALRVKCRGAA